MALLTFIFVAFNVYITGEDWMDLKRQASEIISKQARGSCHCAPQKKFLQDSADLNRGHVLLNLQNFADIGYMDLFKVIFCFPIG